MRLACSFCIPSDTRMAALYEEIQLIQNPIQSEFSAQKETLC